MRYIVVPRDKVMEFGQNNAFGPFGSERNYVVELAEEEDYRLFTSGGFHDQDGVFRETETSQEKYPFTAERRDVNNLATAVRAAGGEWRDVEGYIGCKPFDPFRGVLAIPPQLCSSVSPV